MQQYVLRRLILAVPTLMGVTIIVFGAVRFLPGDVVDQILGDYGALNPDAREELREHYQLNDSIPEQYVRWLGNVFQGDLGTSIGSGRPVLGEITRRAEPTLQLGIIGIIISVVIAIPIGVISASLQATIIDYVARSVSILFLAVPAFWLSLLVITYGWVLFGWSPPPVYYSFTVDPAENMALILPPAIILGINLGAITMRMTRSTMLEVLREDYIRTARAKGLRAQQVVMRHALRNALIPVVTIIGTQVPVVIGGVVILERIFSLPGIGSFLLTSLTLRDYPVVQAIVLMTSVVVIVTNIVVDISYSFLDPRIRYQ